MWHTLNGFPAYIEGICLFYLADQVLGTLIGQRQYLVDQRGDLQRIVADGVANGPPLIRIKLHTLFSQHLRESVDDVQRCTDLMTDVPYKLRPHLVGGTHLLVSGPQFRVLRQESFSGASAYHGVTGHKHDDEDCQEDGMHQNEVDSPRHFRLFLQK